MPDPARKRLPSWGYVSLLGSQKRPKSSARLAVAALAVLLGGLPDNADAQGAQPVRISISATIVARAGSQASLEIGIVPPEALATRSFVSLRGLPEAVSLTDGHKIGAGTWTVPVTALGVLKANIPDGISGRSEIVIRLISMEGSLLATANTALVIEPPTMVSPAAPTKLEPQPPTENTLLLPTPLARAPVEEGKAGRPPNGATLVAPSSEPAREAVATPPPGLSPEQRRLAEKLVAQGERYLAQADVVSARLLFRRAAEAGFAMAAIKLGATYDPTELSRLGAQGVAADEAEARKWYERARALGAPEAEDRLVRLGTK